MSEETTVEEIELSKEAKGVIESVEKMTVLELSQLVKALEDKFGVVAAAPVAVAGAPAAASSGASPHYCPCAASLQGTDPADLTGAPHSTLARAQFTGVFGIQASRSYGVPEKADRFGLFVAMGMGSVLALGAMRALKPKPKKK